MASPNKPIPPLEKNRLYKIGEVSRIVGVESFVLRFWETEFEEIQPAKTETRHRQYDMATIETILQVKDLLHEEKYTIEGARRQLRLAREQSREERAKGRQLALDLPAPADPRGKEAEALLKEVDREIAEIRSALRGSVAESKEKGDSVGE